MLSQVTKQNDENRTLPFPQIKSIEYYLNFFSRKSFRSFLFTHTKFLFCKLNQIYKNHHQNTLHAWGDIKILLLEMKVQLGNVALNIWKWHFLTQLLLIKTWLYEYRKVLKRILFYFDNTKKERVNFSNVRINEIEIKIKI